MTDAELRIIAQPKVIEIKGQRATTYHPTLQGKPVCGYKTEREANLALPALVLAFKIGLNAKLKAARKTA